MDTLYLRRVIELVGGQVALAAAIRQRIPGCKVSQAHVWKWLNRAKCPVPPAEYVCAMAEAVDYEVTPHQLRPDVYPHSQDGLPRDREAA